MNHKQKKAPEQSQWEKALDEPSQRTSRATVVIGAPACYVPGLKPQRCAGFVNFDLSNRGDTRHKGEQLGSYARNCCGPTTKKTSRCTLPVCFHKQLSERLSAIQSGMPLPFSSTKTYHVSLTCVPLVSLSTSRRKAASWPITPI